MKNYKITKLKIKNEKLRILIKNEQITKLKITNEKLKN
jgi:hypothetical protein